MHVLICSLFFFFFLTQAVTSVPIFHDKNTSSHLLNFALFLFFVFVLVCLSDPVPDTVLWANLFGAPMNAWVLALHKCSSTSGIRQELKVYCQGVPLYNAMSATDMGDHFLSQQIFVHQLNTNQHTLSTIKSDALTSVFRITRAELAPCSFFIPCQNSKKKFFKGGGGGGDGRHWAPSPN